MKEEFRISTTASEYRVSTARNEMRVDDIYDMLSGSYWAHTRTLETVRRFVNNSWNIGIFDNDKQIAFARVITDFTTFAYICDVIVNENFRGQGLGKQLMKIILDHNDFALIQSWQLATLDAHGLYKQFGFKPLSFPENRMEFRTNQA